MMFVFLMLSLGSAQQSETDLMMIDCFVPQGSHVCEQRTVAAYACLWPCFGETLNCLVQVGDDPIDLLQCVQGLPEKNDACNQCAIEYSERFSEQIIGFDCDEYTREYVRQCGSGFDLWNEATSDGDDSEQQLEFRTFEAFRWFCREWGTTKAECTALGCNFTARGRCDGKLAKNGEPKLKCKRIRNPRMCNFVIGCSLRKDTDGMKESGKRKVCKGDATFPDDME